MPRKRRGAPRAPKPDAVDHLLAAERATTEQDLDAAAKELRRLLSREDFRHLQAWCDYHRPRIRGAKVAQDLRETAKELRLRPLPIKDLIPLLCRAADALDYLMRPPGDPKP